MDTNSSIERSQTRDNVSAVETFGSQLNTFLVTVGLPTDNILVPYEHRNPVFANLKDALVSLPEEKRKDATYISKFAAASAVGLFDAALNYLWDETIRNLRKKVFQFDLGYFYDSAVDDAKRRSEFSNESDLEQMQDWELIRGCRKTGIISDIGFRHLDYIRDMRNHASAAHPNQNEITGLQIISWLQTCVQEVLSKEPDGPVVGVRSLLSNLRKELLSESDVPPIADGLSSLPQDLVASLLRSVVGLYTDPDVDARVKDNVRLVAKAIWDLTEDEPRREIGLRQANLAANGEATRAGLTREFIELVSGQEYLTDPTLIAEMSAALDGLITAHNGWHNFYNEPAPARLLHRLVPDNGQIPKAILPKYVKTVTMCSIGNGYGISRGAVTYYQELLGRFDANNMLAFINLVGDADIASRLRLNDCAERFQLIAAELQQRSNRPRLNEILTFIAAYPRNRLGSISSDSGYRALRRSLQI